MSFVLCFTEPLDWVRDLVRAAEFSSPGRASWRSENPSATEIRQEERGPSSVKAARKTENLAIYFSAR